MFKKAVQSQSSVASAADHKPASPHKRKAIADTSDNKQRKLIDEMVEELVCAITQELPLDPVTAEDGRIYDRVAIAKWFAARENSNLPIKSPVTNETMSKRLLPAVQIRNNIKLMVKSGFITNDKADAWERLIEDEKIVECVREKGDTIAMVTLANCKHMFMMMTSRVIAAMFLAGRESRDGLIVLDLCHYAV